MNTMTDTEALALVREAITEIVPDADLSRLRPDDTFRDVLELDSLDFLGLVELLSERAGVRIDEDDYPELTTLARAVKFLVDNSR
ncbi:acyl carrier protein [Streptomyces sp. NPDC020801]|uniref:acyl carrier protein n=1 Tax=unclassified Streptomyces TaxID=2593676 RepID=UPI0037AFA89B